MTVGSTWMSMASTPEEFFVESLTDPSPLSPSVFLGLPQIMDKGDFQDSTSPSPVDDMVLSYVWRVLMEDDTEEELLCQDADHPALLQVQEPFAQILFPPPISFNNRSNMVQGCSGDQQCTLNSSAFSKSTAEEQLEEMFETMMLRGYETCIRDIEKLRISKAMTKNSNKAKSSSDVVDLCALLIRCAQAVAAGSVATAQEVLKQIEQHASPAGDATQRLALCFSKALEARLAGVGSQLWHLLTAERRPLVIEYLEAYKLYMAACCFNRVPLFFNILTIKHAMSSSGKKKKRKKLLHILDYGPHHGFQWAALLRWMANWEGGPPEVKITAVSHHLQPKSCPSERVEDTGHRLAKCATEFGVAFKFRAITAAKWETICAEDLETDADEVLVVNDLFNFSTLMDESVYFDRPSPRDTVLSNISKMRPHVFIQGVVNCSYSTSFLARFREALFHYGALFDMLDATIPRESKARSVLEQGMLGHSVLNVIACEGADLANRPEKYRQWQVRNQRAGLRQLPLEPNIVKVVKEKVMKDHHKDFFVGEDGQWLLQGWKGRIIYAHSTWVPQDSISE